MTSSRAAVDELVILLDHSLEETADQFGYDHWHSLIWNLHNVRPEDWEVAPAGGGRTIGDLVRHIGMCYLMYENQAFGDQQRQWGDGQIDGAPRPETPDEWIAWVRASHRIFRDSVAKLTDEQLGDLVSAPWGDQLPARRIVELMLQHPIYHTGEINHIRALLQGNDDWDHQDMGRDDEA